MDAEIGIGFNRNLAHIESLSLQFLGHPHGDEDVRYLEKQIHHNRDKDKVGDKCNHLCTELRCIAIKKSPDRSGHSVETITVRTIGEQSESQESPGAVDPVHGDGTNRIIDLQGPLDKEDADTEEYA